MLSRFLKKTEPRTIDKDLAEARKWTKEARAAEEKGDWARAVVCYRRALAAAPFCSELRAAFEDALEEQIIAGMGEKQRAALEETLLEAEEAAEQAAGLFGFEEDDELPAAEAEEAPRPAGRRKPRQPEEPPPTFRPPRSAGKREMPTRRTMMLAACFAGALTVIGLVAATAASGALGTIFKSELPHVVDPVYPEALAAQLREANDLLRDGKSEETAALLRAASDDFPDFHKDAIVPMLAMAIRSSGLEEMRMKHYESAAEKFREATELTPQNALNWIDLGRALRDHAQGTAFKNNPSGQRKVLADAETAFDRALALAPRDTVALFGLAQVHAAQNDRAKATETYERVVALAPESIEGKMARTNLDQLRKR